MLNNGQIIDNNLIKDKCGNGDYACIYTIQNTNLVEGQDNFALKLCTETGQDEIRRFKEENTILHKLSPHKNIVTPYGHIVDNPPYIYYIMELAKCDLSIFLVRGHIVDEKKIEIFYEICEGLSHAHSKDIIHRDLHWANILIINDFDIKLTDFGKGKDLLNGKKNSKVPCWGWLSYPPEFKFNIFEGSTDVESYRPGDIYALGIILYCMFETVPFQYVFDIQSMIKNFLYLEGINPEEDVRGVMDENLLNLADCSISQRMILYQKWLKIFIPVEKLLVSSISDDMVSEKINKIIAKATNPDFNLRYSKVDDLLLDAKNIFYGNT